jgi:fructosamine-3-kinase
MRHNQAIAAAVGQLLGDHERVRAIVPLSGGCIHHASRVELASGRVIVAKVAAGAAAMLEEEAQGLSALQATAKVLVPAPLGVASDDGVSVSLMSYVKPAPATHASWRRLGEDLAALHLAPACARYGFDTDNHLGSTPQPNGWHDDWVEFNRVHRLGHQRALAASRGVLTGRELVEIDRLIDQLEKFIPHRPRPALLHGDLWSGNALPTDGSRVALIDPAVSVGDGWADIAMMKLFGGFDRATFDSYAQHMKDREEVDERIAIYQLYHLLNHVNIFGRGYADQAMSIVRRLR